MKMREGRRLIAIVAWQLHRK